MRLNVAVNRDAPPAGFARRQAARYRKRYERGKGTSLNSTCLETVSKTRRSACFPGVFEAGTHF